MATVPLKYLTLALSIGLAMSADQAAAQSCGLEGANAVTCLTLDYARALVWLQIASERGSADSTDDRIADLFYSLRSQRNALNRAHQIMSPYVRSPDTAVAEAARYVTRALEVAVGLVDSSEGQIRRAASGKLNSTQLSEGSAQFRVWNDQLFELFIAATGAVLDASLLVEGSSTPVSRRRMTIAQRDAIVSELQPVVAHKGSPETRWTAAADAMRKNLLDQGWKYRP